MLKYLTPFIRFALMTGALTAIVIANSKEQGFRGKLLDYLDDNALTEQTKLSVYEPTDFSHIDERFDHFSYHRGDWDDYIVSPRYKDLNGEERPVSLYESDDVRINTYGSLNLELNYARSIFTRKRYQEYDEDRPVSMVIKPGFRTKQDLQLHVEGSIGDRLTVYIDHDSRKKDNHYMIKYRALRDDELIRELNAGEIDINFQGSKYAVYDNNTAKGLGVDLLLKKNKFNFRAFGSVTKGNSEFEIFRGNSSPGNIKLSEFQYVKGIYYQIEPLIRYNNNIDPPHPAGYALQPVNINPYGFEIYMDDQNPYNKQAAVELPLYGGLYVKLQSGVDYKINYSTGLIQFLKAVPDKARVFAVYSLLGTSTDPYALPPGDPRHPGGQFSGKIFVFLKYGYSLADDPVPGQDHTKQDLYEVRSFYYIGDRYVLPNNFSIQFFLENGIMTQNDISSLGRYSIDYTGGVIEFVYREPYKQLLLASGTASQIYTEHQSVNVYDYSRYRIKIDYYKEARSFQLNHINIIPNSVVIKVDKREVSPSLYTVDYTAGYVIFNNSNNPLIGPQTVIEIRYEYLPLFSQEQQFVGGFRGEYEFSRDLKVGGSLLYSRAGSDEKVPTLGTEPTQTIFFEGDAAVHLDGRRLAQFANIFTRDKIKEVPVELNGYAEYAKSYKNINTFGKALVDNMESIEDIVPLLMEERNWVLSSRPSFPWATTRGILNYYYFRNPVSPGILRGIEYIGIAPKLDYGAKPGPYNVATGHVIDSIISLASQRSLVLDFADNPITGTGDFVSIVTYNQWKDAVDLSGVEYVEISYLYEGSSDTELHLEAGQVNEDADGSGVIKTEDLNNNGIIDSDPISGFTEDIGYQFDEIGHPATRIGSGPGLSRATFGDGILNTSDLNHNGALDVGNNVFNFQNQFVTLSTGSSGWQTARIYIDHSTMTQSEINLLGSVTSVRLSVRKANNVTGRVYIDGIKFVSSKWRDKRLDGNLASPNNLKVTAINNIDDNEYRWEAFSIIEREIYKSMYGVKNNLDLLKERETALKLEYSIPAGSTSVSATRRFSKPMDFRNYKTLTAWVNFRSFNPGDRVGIIIGSSDTDYYVFEMNMVFPRLWLEMRMRLQNNSGGYVFPKSFSGIPDMKRIIFMKVVVYSSTPPSIGALWVDEIYLSEPEVLEDSAHWYEGEIKITKPLYRTKGGVPVMSDFNIKYIQKGHGANFSTIGKKNLDMAEEYKQVFSSFNILPNWNTRIDYVREETETDSLNEEVDVTQRGKTKKNNVMFMTDYISETNGVPSIKLMYKYDDYRNRLDERITNYDVTRNKSQFNHSPVIHYRQTIEKFLGGRLYSELLMNMVFMKEEIKRRSYEMSIQDLAAMTSLLEIEKRQRVDTRFNLDYTHPIFYIRPALQVGSEEVVSWIGKSQTNSTEILYNFSGDYHFPFVYNKNCKFVARNKAYSLSAGLNDFGYVSPGCKVDIQYFENRFRDYNMENVPQYGYKRAKDARTLVSTNFDFPLYLNKVKVLKFIRTFSINYNRSLYLSEMNIPYEGERKGPLDERYGMRRTVGSLADAAFNMFKYYPFCFFIGRKNYAKGRDYIFYKLNMPILYADGTVVSEYNNNLRLLDNFSLNWSVDLNKVTITSNSGLHQICERLNVNGLPAQTVNANFEINVNFDLMRLIHVWIFRPNREGIPYHAAFLTAGYKFETSMYITQNIEEQVHTPTVGLSFKRDRASISLEFGVNLKHKNTVFYISLNPFERSFKDQKYIDNMPLNMFYRDKDTGYSFSAMYETDVKWIYKFFSFFYKLAAFPIFNLEYSMKLNRYDYLLTTSPQPFDIHLVSSKLTLDLHKNIQGGLNAKVAVEQYRNRKRLYLNLDLKNLQKEILSFEVGAHFTLLF
jgi:hypothetical protein